MESYSYAWFIYILTFMLTFAIIFIAFLILYKCIQTCQEMRILCCKKMRRRRRQRREGSSMENRNERRLSLSSTSSLNSSDSLSSIGSSYSEDSSVYQIGDMHTISGDHSSILLEPGHINDGFNDTTNETRLSKKQKKNLINRKYDDASRYEKKMSRRHLSLISNQTIDSQSYTFNQWKNQFAPNINQNKTGQIPATFPLSVNTLLQTASRLNLAQTSNSNGDGEVSFLNHPAFFDVNTDDLVSIKFETDYEIPPPYEQIANRESTV